MKKQILLLCLALTSLCSYAQTITVKGVVTSASDKEPMIGATVQVKGTGTGTITSIDGDYSLNDVAKDAVLVFSSIGYETQEIKVNGQTVINVVLKDASELLDKQENKDKKEDQQKQQQKQSQQNEENMSKENAEQLLNAAMQDEKDTQERIRKAMAKPRQRKLEKQW